MTSAYEQGEIPAIELRHRLRIAREYAGYERDELADAIEVSRNTIGNAESGRTRPRKLMLDAWALACGVPVIASDLDVYREFAGEVPEYLDARDDVAWTEMVAAYCAPHSPARSAQLARLVGWQAPTWAAHFEVVEELVARLGGRGPQV